MNLTNYDKVYFIGIGGIGMSALARWFRQNNFKVAGYDRTSSAVSLQLEHESIPIHYQDDVSQIPTAFISDADRVLVVYTPAVPSIMSELSYFREQGYSIYKRSEVLGSITKDMFTVAVAGTHGKTSTSAMIAHLLKFAGRDIVAFLGGITVNYNSNFILNESIPEKAIAVVEADEYDRSFLTLHPNIAVVTSIDPDHMDIYGDEKNMINSFREFINKLDQNGTLFVQERIASELVPDDFIARKVTYGLNRGQFFADNITIDNGFFVFDYTDEEIRLTNIRLGVSGFHNVENAIVAMAVALQLGVEKDKVKAGMESYQGVRRRFEFVLKNDKNILIDDYAHHPVEIAAFLKSLRALFPTKLITAIFQPHLYSRTRDFASGFAESLEMADQIILLPIYPAREEPIPGVEARMILDLIRKDRKYVVSKDKLFELLDSLKTEVIATIGAGDIDRLVKPLKDHLEAV